MQNIFVSSTFMDLQRERKAVRDAVLRLQYRYLGMEYFGSDFEKPVVTSLRRLSESTIYIALIGHRYGNIDPRTGKSITHLEYEKARELQIPTLVYFKDPSTPIEPSKQYIDFDLDLREKLEKFKERLQEQCVIQVFKTPDDLAAIITADIANLNISLPEISNKSSLVLNRFYEEEDETVLIPLVGPVCVGKTIYGSILCHEPAATLSKKGFLLDIDHGESRFLHMYDRLKRGHILQATMPLEWPSYSEEFRLVSTKSKLERRGYTLRFTDTSGEQWERLTNPEFHLSENTSMTYECMQIGLDNFSALALLIEVNMPGKKPNPKHDLECANIIAQLGLASPTGLFNKPLAIILTKCDLYPKLLIEINEPISYFKEHYPFTYGQTIARLERCNVFAISSLGCSGFIEYHNIPHNTYSPVTDEAFLNIENEETINDTKYFSSWALMDEKVSWGLKDDKGVAEESVDDTEESDRPLPSFDKPIPSQVPSLEPVGIWDPILWLLSQLDL